MSYDSNALEAFFALSREAITGIENGKIRYISPAAEELFGVHLGDDADSVFPGEILADAAERFSASFDRNGESIELNAARQGELLILSARKNTTPSLSLLASAGSLAEFGSSLATAQRAMEAIVSGADDARPQEDSASMLYRSFFRLRRLHRHLTLADCIASDALPCRLRPTDMRELCAELCDSVNQTIRPLGYRVRFEAPDGSCYVMADADLMETLLLNLVTNSLMHTEPGDDIRVTLSVMKDRCILAVDDSGEGMSEEKLAAALSGSAPAVLTDVKSGAGLGLYVSSGIARAHGGSVLLESREGKGTALRISLPRTESDGVEFFSHPNEFRHMDGMNPILTELSVFLNRSFYRKELLD